MKKENIYNPMFGERDNVGDAYVYALEMLEREGCPTIVAMTALHVLLNTIANQLEV